MSQSFFSRDEFPRFTFSDKKNYSLKISFTVPLSKVCVNLLIKISFTVPLSKICVNILIKISFTVPLSKIFVNLLINVEMNVKFDLVTVHIHATVIRIMAIKGVLYN